MRIYTLLICVILAGFATSSKGQGVVTRDSATLKIKSSQMPRARLFNTWDIGAHGGILFPMTDIAASDLNNSVSSPTLGYGLSLTKFLSHTFALHANVMRGTFKGEGAQSGSNMKYNYHTDVNYMATVSAYFQFGNISFLKRNPNIAFFGSVGIGLMNFDPHAYRDGSNTSRSYFVQTGSIDSTVSYKNTTELVYPFGVGFKYRLSKMLSIQAQYTYNVTRSDKLDGFFRLLSENDNFNYFSLGLNVHLGARAKMIEWHNPMYSLYADLYDMKDKVDLMTRDTDEDGVADIFDREPDTPKGNKVYGDGTSIDSDGDGVPDNQDTEPFSAKGSKVDAAGKEIDADGDGIPDSSDMEPNTSKGSLVTKSGITIPTAAKGKGGGASVMATSGWLPSIFFDLNSAEIATKYNETLATIALILRNNPDINLKIVGNCDFRSSYDYNVKLGKRRAEAVKKHLLRKYNIDPKRLQIETLGKNDPITNQDHRMNRRVDFVVVE